MTDTAAAPDQTSSPPFVTDFVLSIDTAIFPREVVLRTCYAFTDRCHFWLRSESATSILIAFRRKDETGELDCLKGEFGNALIDFGLRASIEANTRAVR